MVAVGQEMSNPRSGERFVWRATRASTSGAYCEFDLHLSADAAVAAPHRHPTQEERFTVVTGALTGRCGPEGFRIGPGQEVVIPRDTAHAWSNPDRLPSQVRVRLTPALDIEDYFASFCAIATAGRAGATGLPRNALQLAVLLDGFRAEFDFAARWQHVLLVPLLRALAAIGRRRGYRTRVGDST